MASLNIYHNGLWHNPCTDEFRIYKDGVWQLIKSTDRFYYDGQWITMCSVPTCPDRAVVFQICNSNAITDDNFDVYLNNTLVGSVDLSSNSLVGSVFIASLTTPTITSADFVCPVGSMVHYYFNPNLLQSVNTIKMINTQNNNMGNAGSVGIRNYLIDGDTLHTPCVIADLTYSGSSGSNFEMIFNYTACCPGDI